MELAKPYIFQKSIFKKLPTSNTQKLPTVIQQTESAITGWHDYWWSIYLSRIEGWSGDEGETDEMRAKKVIGGEFKRQNFENEHYSELASDEW